MKAYLIPSLAVLTLALATPGLSLERTSARMPDDAGGNDWSASATSNCISYYNTCQGWIWLWGGWSPGDRVGTYFDGVLFNWLPSNWLYTEESVPAGYACTGTISVWAADADRCPTTMLASQPWVPGGGWVLFQWNILVPGPFVIVEQWDAPPGFLVFSRMGSDHPAAGPTGVQACGLCYPTTRQTHSFYYGQVGSTLCPGSALFDGTCDAEWLVSVTCPPVSVEETTWGQIKSLYH